MHPYAFVGLSLFHFNQRPNLKGEWCDLQPPGTEEQGVSKFPGQTPCMLSQFAIPKGAAFSRAFGSQLGNTHVGAYYGDFGDEARVIFLSIFSLPEQIKDRK